jgi:hypothetical protein
VLGTVGLAAIAIAVAIAVAPDDVSTIVPIRTLVESTPLSSGSSRTLAFAIGGTICAVWIAWTAGETRSKQLPDGPMEPTDTGFRTLREEPPEHALAGSVVGDQFDEAALRAAIAAADGDDDPVRAKVRSLAVDVVARTEGCSETEAEAIVAEADWTDDAVAAAYVADREASLSLWRRLLAWLRPSRTKFDRIDRALEAIDRRQRGRT